jgi:hypothetical protein
VLIDLDEKSRMISHSLVRNWMLDLNTAHQLAFYHHKQKSSYCSACRFFLHDVQDIHASSSQHPEGIFARQAT